MLLLFNSFHTSDFVFRSVSAIKVRCISDNIIRREKIKITWITAKYLNPNFFYFSAPISINARGLLYAVAPIVADAILFAEFGLDLNDLDRQNEIEAVNRLNKGATNKRYYPFCVTHQLVRYLRVPTERHMMQHLSRPSRAQQTTPRNVSLHSFEAYDVTDDIDTYMYMRSLYWTSQQVIC